ncbi:hypothetical protein SASPL_152607 [Salvia splendens]|uniref:Uncharacterized protein n=1 Tax=Salvia splendens TaxID=180675 RepID=A0A8X8W3A6_SALSN|nr:uncharacterized protein LOC121783378 [Salvia splendens]KAG6387420.1 hypothetical protein SASPL_152607 [Salvia splendens]
MNHYNQGESSSGLSILPLKRRRGRPRKDPSLKRAQAAHAPPGYEGAKEYHPQRADRADGVNSMVGQAVGGVVEATFDAGYLLTVQIGNSTTKLRGVVFKPGNYVPVTAENDVAPHLQMIRRNDVQLPSKNRGWSRRQKLAIQAGAPGPSKRKSGTPLAAPSVPTVGARGTVVPVVLQPTSFQNGLPTSNQMPSDASRTSHVLSFGDKDVHMAEPLSMLPPDKSIPVSQLFVGAQPHMSHQISQGTEQNDTNPFNEGGTSEVRLGEKENPTESTENDISGSSESSDTQTDSGKEATKSPAEDAGVVSKQDTQPFSTESVQSASVTKPFFNYGTGRMTELLQAVQENMKDTQTQIAEHPPSGSNNDVHAESDTKLEASAAP